LAGLRVSRETKARLRHFEALLRKWNPAINLVAKATLDQFWNRHILDSTQIYTLDDTGSRAWADLGSGGGFPGLVVAILAKGEGRDLAVTLVESDRRKAAFLMTVARELDLTVRVLDQRIEALPPLGAGIISARALAPLADLLGHAVRHLAADGLALFPKGATHAAELRQALGSWRFSYRTTASVTDQNAVIYSIRGITRA
jgi:16S rRNA (guanine527-N7)-methyltransferase